MVIGNDFLFKLQKEGWLKQKKASKKKKLAWNFYRKLFRKPAVCRYSDKSVNMNIPSTKHREITEV